MDRLAARLRLAPGDLLAAGCALALLAVMFAFAWYGIVGLPGRAGGRVVWSEDAWHGLTVIRWVMLTTIATALGAALIHWRQRDHGARTSTGPLVGGLGLLTTVLLIFRVLLDPPSANDVVDQKLGAVLGLACALGIALGGRVSWRAERLPGSPQRDPIAAGPGGSRVAGR